MTPRRVRRRVFFLGAVAIVKQRSTPLPDEAWSHARRFGSKPVCAHSSGSEREYSAYKPIRCEAGDCP